MSDVNNVEEQDILEKFRTAVRNGQTRLALESLVDVIDAIVEIIAPSDEPIQDQQPEQKTTETQVVEEKPSSKKKQKDSKEDQPVAVIAE